MAEWSIAAVLKTVEPRGSGGSNPSFSATVAEKTLSVIPGGFFRFLAGLKWNCVAISTSENNWRFERFARWKMQKGLS